MNIMICSKVVVMQHAICVPPSPLAAYPSYLEPLSIGEGWLHPGSKEDSSQSDHGPGDEHEDGVTLDQLPLERSDCNISAGGGRV